MMGMEDFQSMGGDQTLVIVETLGLETMIDMGADKITDVAGAMAKENFQAIGADQVMEMAAVMHQQNLASIGDAAAVGIIEPLSGEQLGTLESDQLVGITSSLDPTGAHKLGAEQILSIVSNMDAFAISYVDGSIVSAMMDGLSSKNIAAMGINHQGAVLETMGADLLDSRGSGFDNVVAVATTFDQVITSVAAEGTQASTDLNFFSSSDLFSMAITTPSG